MRVGYGRVCTTDRSPELQLNALRQAGCEMIYTEIAAGAKTDRPELAFILDNMLHSGDSVVVWRLDRIARSFGTLISTVEDLERRGIGLVSLSESIDTTASAGGLVFDVFRAISSFKQALIRERACAALAEARRQGRKGGRPPALDTAEIAVARTLLKESSLTVRAVAKHMGVSVNTVYRYAGRRGGGGRNHAARSPDF